MEVYVHMLLFNSLYDILLNNTINIRVDVEHNIKILA